MRKGKYNPLTEKQDFPCIELESIEQDSCRMLEIFKAKNQKSIKTKFLQGDVLFGKLRPYLRKFLLPTFEGVCSTEIWALHSSIMLNSYLFYYLQTENFMAIANTSSGTKMPRAEWNLVSNADINYPDSIEEMTKISNMLGLIDERIATQSKIIEELKLLKIAITNHLIFNNPELKEKIKLGDFAILKNGYAFKSDTYTDDGAFNIITIANVQGEKNINLKSCNKISYIPDDIQPHQILRNNDILVSLTGNAGRVSLVNVGNCLLNQRVGVLKFKNDLFKHYIYQVISSKNFENKMILKGQGAAQKNIGNDDVESFIIPFSHNKLLINKIVNLLDSFDKKIAIEEQIISDYISQKKYLLSNMFI